MPNITEVWMQTPSTGPINHRTVKGNAYNFIHIRKEDEWKKAFITKADQYRYMVMPY